MEHNLVNEVKYFRVFWNEEWVRIVWNEEWGTWCLAGAPHILIDVHEIFDPEAKQAP